MQFKKKIFVLIAAAAAGLALAGCNFSLAGDVTPPPNYVASTVLPTNPAGGDAMGGAAGGSSAATPQPTTQQTVFPLVPPDPAQGAALFTANCVPCHGDSGMGNGAQAAQLPNMPAAIGSPELARKSRPSDWYNTITNGNMKQFMPPFAQALSDRQRWDVLAYVYTLSNTSADLQAGKTLYAQSCAECHGAAGLGDGVKAASLTSKPIAWAKDQSRLALLSADDIVKVIESGKGEMPAYQGKLNPEQSYQVAAYVRSLSFSTTGAAAASVSTGTPAAVGTGEPAATLTTGQVLTITGQVTNGTPGGTVPASGLKAALSVYSGMSLASSATADVAADGSYTFKDVKLDPNNVYIVGVDSNGVTFSSDILHGTDAASGKASLPVKIYEPATDTAPLVVDRLHVFFDFSNPGVVQVVNLYIISNPTDHVIVQKAKGQPVLSFSLPQGATNLKFQDGALGGRYLQTADGFGDTMGVAPGASAHQIIFAYDMPYTNKLDLAVKAPLPVDAAIVMVPPGMNLSSSQLSDAGQQDVQGTSFHMFQSKASLKAGDQLKLSLAGSPSAASSGSAAAATSQNSMNFLLIGLGAFGLVLVAAGVWLYMRRRQPEPVEETTGAAAAGPTSGSPEDTSEALLDDIVALDDLHASGSLPDAAYYERRAELKTRLGDALAREKGN